MGLTRSSVGRGASKSPSARDGTLTIALAGNPNVGKSTLFNALTGMHQHTGNWPGKTVTSAQGICKKGSREYKLIDLPGTYSLNPHSAEEEVAREFISSESCDAVVVICDATSLRKSLPLALNVLSITKRMVVCINLSDEAKKHGTEIDTKKLSALMGVPVVSTEARSKKGLDSLLRAIDEVILKEDLSDETGLFDNAIQEADAFCDAVIKKSSDILLKKTLAADKLLTSRKFGIPLMLLLLLFVFWLTVKGANLPSKFLSELLFSVEAPLYRFLSFLNLPSPIINAAVFGIWRTLAWVVSVMLPPMAIFFPLFTILEDLGYLPRVAFNLDRAFKGCGACGKQSLTICMGLGCNAAGVIGCRIIDSRRERLIAILTNSFVPCNGRFPTLITLITIFLVGMRASFLSSFTCALYLLGFIVLGILCSLLASRILSKTLLRGIPSSFTLELPPYRYPQPGKILIRSIFDRTLFVLGRAITVAAPAGLILWLLANISVDEVTLLYRISSFLDPFGRFLGLDGVIIMAFILGLPANEIVLPIIIMAYSSQGMLTEIGDLSLLGSLLSENGWTFLTALNTAIFSLMHWPCATTLLTIKKETQSLLWTILSAVLPTVFGVLLCIITKLIFSLF